MRHPWTILVFAVGLMMAIDAGAKIWGMVLMGAGVGVILASAPWVSQRGRHDHRGGRHHSE